MGVDRAVFVQPTIYGSDHRLLHNVLKTASTQNYRGVAIVDDTAKCDTELARLHSVGVRGVRLYFWRPLQTSAKHCRLPPAASVVCVNLVVHRSVLGFLRTIFWPSPTSCARSIPRDHRDHMGGPDYRCGTAQPAIRLYPLDLLKNGNWWVGLSNGDLRLHSGYPWDDAIGCRMFYQEAVPNRSLGHRLASTCIASRGPTKTDTRTMALTTNGARRAARTLSPRPRRPRPGAGRQSGGFFGFA